MANITGTAANDFLEGTGFNDSISGLAGSDTLLGGGGFDDLNGGDGDDTLDGGDGIDRAVYSTAVGAVTVDLAVGTASGGAGLDTLISIERLIGSSSNDTLIGGDGDNDIFGWLGHDLINGGDGDDSLLGGDGNDTLDGGAGDDDLRGDADNDVLRGGAGQDDLWGDEGNDVLEGGPGRDSFVTTDLGGGIDLVTDFEAGASGDAVDETYFLSLSASSGYVGGNPFDVNLGFLRVVQSEADTLVQWDRDGAAGSGFDWVTVLALQNIVASTLSGSNFESGYSPRGGTIVDGTAGNDRLTGTAGDDVLRGLGGDDELSGLGGDDFLNGGAGADTLEGGAGNDTLDGGLGADIMRGGLGNDTYHVDNTGDVLEEVPNEEPGVLALVIAQALDGFIDTVIAAISFSLANVANVENLLLAAASAAAAGTGNELDNVLTGNELNNTLTGLGGNDTLDGAAGTDTASYSGARSGYTVAHTDLGYTVSGPEGVDTLSSVERAQFFDQGLAFDLGLNQAAGNTVRVIGAAFDAPAIEAHPEWVGIGLDFFDGGMSLPTVCDLVASLMGQNNSALVTTLFTNVVGFAPDAATRDGFLGLLQGSGGSMTQGQLLELAATVSPNETNIGLVGLLQSGVEFV